MFDKIDYDNWARKPYFDQYFNQMKCTYSISVNLDISRLMNFRASNKVKLHPVLVYSVAKTVNRHKEFRMAMDTDGNIGIWDYLHPCHTVFHKDSESFSNIWTEWNDDFRTFLDNWTEDIEKYGYMKEINPKPGMPENVFPISSLPWTTFTGFNLNITSDGTYLFPIFTFGKYFISGKKTLIPLSVQVHHAVCDGFHVSRFINDLQSVLDSF